MSRPFKELVGYVAKPLNLYVKVSASQPFIAAKGELRFVEPAFVQTLPTAYAHWIAGRGHLELGFTAAPGTRSYIDCAVASAAGEFIIEGPGGTKTTASKTGHLLFSFDAESIGWHFFRISAARDWNFFSCEVKRP